MRRVGLSPPQAHLRRNYSLITNLALQQPGGFLQTLGLQRGVLQLSTLKSGMSLNANHNRANIKVLVIEEYSMVSAEVSDLLNRLAQRMKTCQQPFGGVRVLLVGDIAQLASVQDLERDASGNFLQ